MVEERNPTQGPGPEKHERQQDPPASTSYPTGKAAPR